jgi:SAM-dependent methyltransferase
MGSLVTGLVLLDRLGTPGTLRALVLSGVAFVAVLAAGRRRLAGLLLAGLAATAAVLPGGRALWLRLHGLPEGPTLVAEDATSVVALAPADTGLHFLFVNGKSNSVLPYGPGEHTFLGAVPAAIHPAPRDVAIIGLGSGNTAWAAACRPETVRVRVFEIAGPQPRLLELFQEGPGSAKLGRFLADARVSVEVADGRNALEREQALYDLIEADALRPWTAYSGNLYSQEFFARCARRLKPGGVMCTWAPTPRVRRTFARVFPGAVAVGAILVGGREPIAIDQETWAARLREDPVVAHLGPLAVRRVIRALRGAERVAPPPPGSDANRDLHPRDEFSVP